MLVLSSLDLDCANCFEYPDLSFCQSLAFSGVVKRDGKTRARGERQRRDTMGIHRDIIG